MKGVFKVIFRFKFYRDNYCSNGAGCVTFSMEMECKVTVSVCSVGV